jgi:hypothetical protein
LPQTLADQFGWREPAVSFAELCKRLPGEDKAKACIFAGNYGEAGAPEFFGEARGLPPVISSHNSYFLWGPGGCTREAVLFYAPFQAGELEAIFESVEPVGQSDCRYCMPYENHKPIYLCKGFKLPLEEIWERLKLNIYDGTLGVVQP